MGAGTGIGHFGPVAYGARCSPQGTQGAALPAAIGLGGGGGGGGEGGPGPGPGPGPGMEEEEEEGEGEGKDCGEVESHGEGKREGGR